MKEYLKFFCCELLLSVSVITGITVASLMLFGVMNMWQALLMLILTGVGSWLSGHIVVERYQSIKRKKERKIALRVLHNPQIYGSIIGEWQ